MSAKKVADIVVGQADMNGVQITTVYSKVSERFAVYATNERVMIQYADDDVMGQEQRLAMMAINPVRGEINGFIADWRSETSGNGKSRARDYDRRTADALAVALQGNVTEAQSLLEAIRTDIIAERTSLGRFQYLIVATVTAIAIIILLWLITLAVSGLEAFRFAAFLIEADTWMAAGLGSLGAIFSIALAIRGRQMQTDLRKRDNIIDAVLRVCIGAISAFILFSLLKSRLVSVSLLGQDVTLDGEGAGSAPTHVAIVVAFLAGFSERLVGDFFGSAALEIAQKREAAAHSATSKTATDKAAAAAATSETDPLGKTSTATQAGSSVEEEHDHDHSVDNCVCDLPLEEGEETDDVDLPRATGGVEKAAA